MSEPDAERVDWAWDVPDQESPAERRRRQRREYHQRRSTKSSAGQEHGRRWTIADARVALDLGLSVKDAAAAVGRSANAVESLRRRWRAGRLPTALADQVATTRGQEHPKP